MWFDLCGVDSLLVCVWVVVLVLWGVGGVLFFNRLVVVVLFCFVWVGCLGGLDA